MTKIIRLGRRRLSVGQARMPYRVGHSARGFAAGPAKLVRGFIEEDVERRDLAIADSDDIPAGIFRRPTTRAGTPGQTPRILEHLRLAMWCVDIVGMRRP